MCILVYFTFYFIFTLYFTLYFILYNVYFQFCWFLLVIVLFYSTNVKGELRANFFCQKMFKIQVEGKI